MHVCYSSLGGFRGRVQYIRRPTVCVEGFVQRHVEVGDCAVSAEDFVQVRGSDVFCQFFDDDLVGREGLVSYRARVCRHWRGKHTFELRGIGGVGLRSRPRDVLRAR